MNRWPHVTIVTPVHNEKTFTQKYLNSLFNSLDYDNWDVIIVDDASSDGTAEMLKEDFPKAIHLKGDGSLYWSGGTNMGVIESIKRGTDFILTMNNDVEFESNFLKALVQFSITHNRAIVGSKVLYLEKPDIICDFGRILHPIFGEQLNGGEKYSIEFNQDMQVDAVIGISTLIPSEVFSEIGLYDTAFPLVYADTDLTARAAKSGTAVWVTSDSIIYNDHTHSGGLLSHLKISSLRDAWNFYWNNHFVGNPRLLARFYQRHYPWYRFWIPFLFQFFRRLYFISITYLKGKLKAKPKERFRQAVSRRLQQLIKRLLRI